MPVYLLITHFSPFNSAAATPLLSPPTSGSSPIQSSLVFFTGPIPQRSSSSCTSPARPWPPPRFLSLTHLSLYTCRSKEPPPPSTCRERRRPDLAVSASPARSPPLATAAVRRRTADRHGTLLELVVPCASSSSCRSRKSCASAFSAAVCIPPERIERSCSSRAVPSCRLLLRRARHPLPRPLLSCSKPNTLPPWQAWPCLRTSDDWPRRRRQPQATADAVDANRQAVAFHQCHGLGSSRFPRSLAPPSPSPRRPFARSSELCSRRRPQFPASNRGTSARATFALTAAPRLLVRSSLLGRKQAPRPSAPSSLPLHRVGLDPCFGFVPEL
ncbi:uncharacterized protein [Aegilops tauschii subsp. strangulata]|uniref:uncharacterized protein n=1 Tax=Aegilops tauschii subsp. strangulata TaxID=200361 RepID=UPI003CC8E0CE